MPLNLIYLIMLVGGIALIAYLVWDLGFNPFGPNTPYRLKPGVTLEGQIRVYWLTFSPNTEYAAIRSHANRHGYSIIDRSDLERIAKDHIRELEVDTRIICEDRGELWAMDIERGPKGSKSKLSRIFPVYDRGELDFAKIGLKKPVSVSEKEPLRAAA